jgi:putative Mn2+ efflux pump MntP
MNIWQVIGLAFGLSMDAFAVATGCSIALKRVRNRHVARLALSFGFFQFAMPVLGWLAGTMVVSWISGLDHWLAFGLLAWVGGKQILEGLRGDCDGPRRPGDPTRGLTLLILSFATSIDALAVGLGLAALKVSVWGPSVVIGLVCAGMTALGMMLGQKMGRRLGRPAGVAGGVVLLAIGLKILADHLL